MCCEPISLLHSSRASSCEQKLCEPISLLYFLSALSCEQKLCEPISLLHSSRASSCEQKLCEPLSLSLERALSSETGSQDPCSARYAVTAWQHFMLLCTSLSSCHPRLERCGGPAEGRQYSNHPSIACAFRELLRDPRLLYLQSVVPVSLLLMASN